MPRIAILLITAATAVGLCGLVTALWNRSASFLAETWQDELERAPEHHVDAVLDRLAGLDDAAIPALAIALASSRECVAKGAAKVLRRQPARWQSLPADAAARRQRQLARALADVWPRLGSTARRAAAETVVQLLSRSPPEGGLGDAEFLAACAEVLRAEALPGADPLQRPARPPVARLTSSGRETASLDQEEPLETSGFASVSDIPSPSEVIEPKTLRPSDGAAPLPSAARVPHPLRESTETPSQPKAMNGALVDSASAASNEPRRLSPVRQAGFDERWPHEGAADGIPKGTVDLRQLARRLNDENPQQVEAARKELQGRGFSVVEMELARQLAHPDAGVRKKLARALPETVGVDAAPWLLELTRDPDADVRLEAMTLLATTGDPALLEALRRLAAADPDERIQRLSGRLNRATSSAREHATK